MGIPHPQSDHYFLEEHSQLPPDSKYFWIDPNMTNRENLNYLETFERRLKVTPMQLPSELKLALDLLRERQSKAYVISSAAFPESFYQQLQESEAVKEVTLFTTYQDKADELIQRYSKIKHSFLHFDSLYSHLLFEENKAWKSIGMFLEQDIGDLNCWTVNWRVLVQEVNRRLAKEQFLNFAKRQCTRQEYIAYERQYDTSKKEESKRKMVLEWIDKKNFYLRLPNQLLMHQDSPFKLAYLRQPVLDIFTTIKSHYNNKQYGFKKVFVRMRLNRQEISQLTSPNSLRKFMYFRSFVECTLYEETDTQAPNEIDFILHLPSRSGKKYCSGFYLNETRRHVILNLGNFFSIMSVDTQASGQTKVHLELIMQNRYQKYTEKHELYGLNLHQRYISYLISRFPGQILSSYFSNRLEQYNQYIDHEINGLLAVSSFDRRISMVKRGIQMAKLKLYFGIANAKQIIEDYKVVKNQIQQLFYDKGKTQYKQYCSKIYLGIAELSYKEKEIQMMAKVLVKVQELARDINLSKEEHTIMHLLNIYKCIVTNPLVSSQFLVKFDQIQNGYRINYPQYGHVSTVAYLIKHVKITSLRDMGREQECLFEIKELMKTIALCQGKRCSAYQELSVLQEDIERTRRFRSLIPSLELGEIELGVFDFSLYDDDVQNNQV